jgi:hypothetical protein
MPHCYLLSLSAGSSLDQQSNNITLFNLVEQVNVPPGAPPPPNNLLPLEVHAYFRLSPAEVGSTLEMRFALVAASGLETFSEVVRHQCATPRFRTRTFGVPFPPIVGHYELRVDFRLAGTSSWSRDPLAWPLSVVEMSPKPRVTH